ncbi:Xylulose kinase [subsurface metagenome]
MEGCCFDMYESFNTAIDIGLNLDEIIVTGGPSKSSLWCQIMSDVTNRKIVTVDIPEAAPFGDAILAGVGTKVFKSFNYVANKYIKIKRIYKPIIENHNLYERLFKIYKEIYNANIEIFDSIAEIFF